MNNVSISGRIANEVEIRSTIDGTAVCAFCVAVDRPMAKDTTDFIDCVAWRQKADFVGKYFQKGDPIEITGYLTTQTYEDKNGNKHKAVKILCDQIGFTKSKKQKESSCDYSEGVISDNGVPF